MKLLVTTGSDAETAANYVRWLESGSMLHDLLGPKDAVPHSLAAYSALLLGGGGDIDPRLYGERPSPKLLPVDHRRDVTEIGLEKTFLDLGKPIFGICRGIQLINVCLGGKLVQHIPDLVEPEREEHRRLEERDSSHPLCFTRISPLSIALANAANVNSAHHQAVRQASIGIGLEIAAVSPAGVVEALSNDDSLKSPVLAVQWHPERMPANHPASRGVLSLMKQLCRD